MKKIVLFVLIIISAAINVRAESKFFLSVDGGYSLLSMKDANDYLDFLAVVFEGPSVKINEGWMVTLEGLYKLTPRLAIGPRVEYIIANKGKITFPWMSNPFIDNNGNQAGNGL
jgi:hypothetical protein